MTVLNENPLQLQIGGDEWQELLEEFPFIEVQNFGVPVRRRVRAHRPQEIIEDVS